MISPDVVPRRQRNSIPKRLMHWELYDFGLAFPTHLDVQPTRNGLESRGDRRSPFQGAESVSSRAAEAPEDVSDVGLRFGIRRQAAITLNGTFAGVIGS